MAKKKKTDTEPAEYLVQPDPYKQPITETIEKNYMPYVMSVIISRAIPEIDGFKPSHRKLLYTMYKLNLLSGQRMKSAKVVGATMQYNPHGDASIYETLVRLTRDNESLLHPFVDSKGSFGKQYSDMAYAAARYTEVKLEPICKEIFGGINKNAVDFMPNYDNTDVEPVLFPTSFPNILISANLGIAVGMASKICSFNLSEICDGTIELLKNSRTSVDRMLDIVKAPDFPGGGILLYNREKLKEIYATGHGSFKVRSKYRYDKENNCIEVTEIPYSTTIEQIMKKIGDGIKEGKIKEIVDYRDEIDFNGFTFTIDLRRGVDPDKLMLKLFKMTPLEDSFGCNFNVLIDGQPRVMGIIEILNEWIRFRMNCVRRELTFDLNAKKDKLHLLTGLGKILLDIDKAISIVRNTEKEEDVVPNLAREFDLSTVQAEYVADIKLRYLNREYILNRISEITELQKQIEELEDLISSDEKIKKLIADQLREIKKKYGIPRKTLLVEEENIQTFKREENIENYNVKLFFTKEGYFKKCTLTSLRGNDEQTLKDGDAVKQVEECENIDEVIFFSDKGQVYKAKLSDFDAAKASVLGDYIPTKLGFEKGERAIYMKVLKDVSENDRFVFIFKNGKGVRIPPSCYETKSNRKKLTGAYSTVSPIAGIFYEKEPFSLFFVTDNKRGALISTKLIAEKSTRSAGGITLVNLKKGAEILAVYREDEAPYQNTQKYKKIKVPATPSLLEEYDFDKLQLGI